MKGILHSVIVHSSSLMLLFVSADLCLSSAMVVSSLNCLAST